jgi:3-oxoacyl-[acyl-carrier protein] reductase
VSFAGRAAIVTGAAQGLGLACAEALAREGAAVLMADFNGPKVEEASRRLAASGARAKAVRCDVSVGAEVAAMAGAAMDAFGRIDILVNNAGGSGSAPANDIEQVTDAIWADVIGRNLTGTFLCCRAVVPHMKAARYGRIVNFSSGLARGTGRPQGTAGAVLPYTAAKAGILGLTTVLAKTLAPWNITVNAVVPGFVLTEPGARVRDWFDALPEDGRKALLSRNPTGRAGKPEEVAGAVLYLASEAAGFVSGVALDVSGAA